MDGSGAEGWLGFILFIGILLCALLTGGGSAIYYCSARGSRFAEVLMQLGALACIASILAAGLGFFLLTGDPEYAWGLIWLILLCFMVGVLQWAYRKWKDE